jgi:hypothetical protein
VKTYGPPAEAYREAARLLLQQDAQASIRQGGLKGLVTETKTYDVERFAEKSSRWEAGKRSICGWHMPEASCLSSQPGTPCPGYTWRRLTGWITRE